MNEDHPAITELYEIKAKQSAASGHDVRRFAAIVRAHEGESKKRGIKFVNLSNKESSAYAKRMSSGPLPKNYWKRKPVRPFVDPIEEEIKAVTKKVARKRPSINA